MPTHDLSSSYFAPFGPRGEQPVDAAFLRRLLSEALGRGGDYADVFFEYTAAASFGYEDQTLKSLARSVGAGVGIRVLHGEATGFAFTENLAEAALLQAARTAAQIASGGGRVAGVELRATNLPQRYPIEALSLEADVRNKRALFEEADSVARTLDARVTRVDCSLAEEVRELLVANSLGVFAHDRQPLVRFGVRVMLEHGGKRESGSSGGGGRVGMEYFEGRSARWHAERAVEHAAAMIDAREAPAGEFPVVLAPGDSGILIHEAVGHGLEADFIRKKSSNYTDRVGDTVASDKCTVVDDPSVGFSRGSINIDDEGGEPETSMLIERGVLRGYLHDVRSAQHFGRVRDGRPRGGSGRRESFRSAPLPRMTNTFLLAGDDAPEDIVRSVKRGIYAKRFGGGQVNISNGDFVFSLTEGYLIEDGAITAPLKGVNLIGNGPEVMRRVSMLGSDFEISDGIWTCGKDGQSVPVGVGCPTVKIERVTVGGTAGAGGSAP